MLARMTSVSEPPPYYALRVCPAPTRHRGGAPRARAADRAPWAIQAILAGRTRVEVSAQDAIAALSWARTLEGWGPTASRRCGCIRLLRPKADAGGPPEAVRLVGRATPWRVRARDAAAT